jgi:hypothetical protein
MGRQLDGSSRIGIAASSSKSGGIFYHLVCRRGENGASRGVITSNSAGTVTGGLNILLNVCDGPSAPQCP